MQAQPYNLIDRTSQTKIASSRRFWALAERVRFAVIVPLSARIGCCETEPELDTTLATDARLTKLSERTMTCPDNKKCEDGV